MCSVADQKYHEPNGKGNESRNQGGEGKAHAKIAQERENKEPRTCGVKEYVTDKGEIDFLHVAIFDERSAN